MRTYYTNPAGNCRIVAGTTGDGDDGATETTADTDTTASTDANVQHHTAIIANPVALPAPASHELGHGPRTVASDAARRLSTAMRRN